MAFDDFIGSAEAVARVRGIVASGNTSRTLILAGPRGSGRTTLALMAGLALNCRRPPAAGDFCGTCESCREFCGFDGVEAVVEEARSFRDEQVKTRAREDAPLVVRLHPQIQLFPADGDFLSIHQVRELIRLSQLRPDKGRHWALVLPEFDTTRWLTQTALLKTLEEPPERTMILLLVTNPLELLPTVRSRGQVITLTPAEDEAIARVLEARRRELTAGDRKLIVRLAQGCAGRALTLDLAAYRELREQALVLAGAAAGRDQLDASSLFAATENWRTDKEKFESLIEILYSVVQDILHLTSGNADAMRNVDCRAELSALARGFSFEKLVHAVEGLDSVLAASRRNANRPLALDAWAMRLAR